MPVMRFIDPNWDINDFHKHPQGLMRFIAQFCSVWAHERLRASHKYSTSFTRSFQPLANLPMFQQKVNNEVDESQHTLNLPLDSRLNPGLFMNAEV